MVQPDRPAVRGGLRVAREETMRLVNLFPQFTGLHITDMQLSGMGST